MKSKRRSGYSKLGEYFKIVDTRTGKVNVFGLFGSGTKKVATFTKQSRAKAFIKSKRHRKRIVL